MSEFTLDMMLKAKKILDEAAMPCQREYFMWDGHKVTRHAVLPKPNIDILRNRLGSYGMKLV